MTRQGLLRASISLLALAALSLPATAAGKQTKVSKNHCEVIAGGCFVEIPDFPGERIDRRLLKDPAGRCASGPTPGPWWTT
jgi:hypothetical protein